MRRSAPDAFTEIQQDLEHYHLSTRRYLLKEEDAIAAVLLALNQARERIADWPLERKEAQDWAAIAGGLKRVYQLVLSDPDRIPSGETVEALLALIEQRQQELQATAALR